MFANARLARLARLASPFLELPGWAVGLLFSTLWIRCSPSHFSPLRRPPPPARVSEVDSLFFPEVCFEKNTWGNRSPFFRSFFFASPVATHTRNGFHNPSLKDDGAGVRGLVRPDSRTFRHLSTFWIRSQNGKFKEKRSSQGDSSRPESFGGGRGAPTIKTLGGVGGGGCLGQDTGITEHHQQGRSPMGAGAAPTSVRTSARS